MRILSSLALATLLAGSACLAEDTPPTTPPAAQPPAAGQPGGEGPDRGRDGYIKRLIAEDPALKGVDPNTPEGKAKIDKAMQVRMEKHAPEMRQRMADMQAQSHTKLREGLGMPTEDFTAVEPLITKVENLRMQGRLADPQGLPFGMGRGGPGGGRGGSTGGFNPMRMMMGDTPLDPTAQEIQDAAKALSTLLADAQANGNEVTATMARLRKAREAFKTALGKAQEELRSVMTPRQEAVLVDRGILD